MTYMFARSKAGHDKGQVYLVVSETGDFVYLADGKQRPVEKPKKKNRKHIQFIKKLPGEVTKVLDLQTPPGNIQIKRALKLYISREED